MAKPFDISELEAGIFSEDELQAIDDYARLTNLSEEFGPDSGVDVEEMLEQRRLEEAEQEDAWIQEEVAKYERRKAEARKKIKPDIERSLKTSQNGYSRHYEGDEIGTLLVRTPDGELVGVYCGDTEQSVKYTYDMLHDEVGFRLTPTMPGRTAAQKALLYRCYIR